jgi:hypothetical protein
MYGIRKTVKNGVTRSLMPCTYPLAGCRTAQMYRSRSYACVLWSRGHQLTITYIAQSQTSDAGSDGALPNAS